MPSVLVTGCSSGIGLDAARHLQARGWTVLATCRAEDDLAARRAEGMVALPLDLADPASVAACAQAALDHGPVDALVNNAGISPKGQDGARLGTLDTQIDDWKWVFQVNFFASIMLARGLLEELKKTRGAVVNVTSIAGSKVHPFAGAAYATSKAALMSLTREMAHDFGPLGIRVNAISPGEIDTSILSPGRRSGGSTWCGSGPRLRRSAGG